MEKILFLLKEILINKNARKYLVFCFQYIINNEIFLANIEEIDAILDGLLMNMDYYEPYPELCREDPSYYGDEKLEILIKEALGEIEKLLDEAKAEGL
ncbi:MAG: hypothetical protein WCR42_07820 [bacterium]